MSDVVSLLDEIRGHFGTVSPPELFHRMAEHEAYLRSTWQKYQAVMLSGEIEAATKQLMGLAVAVSKSNDYMVGWQKREARRAGLSESQQLEALAVADFFEGFDSLAHALHVDSELRPRKLAAGDMSLIDREVDVNVPYVLDSDDPTVREVYADIKRSMHIPFVPNIFNVLGHQPAMLEAKWKCYQAVMGPGKLRSLTKELVAVAVSAVNACFY